MLIKLTGARGQILVNPRYVACIFNDGRTNHRIVEMETQEGGTFNVTETVDEIQELIREQQHLAGVGTCPGAVEDLPTPRFGR